jgi:NADH:ubiquinone oxidoreductase subunit 5 (subunit L)/multisubunit Na+/H+ antiporter MnhA subunit
MKQNLTKHSQNQYIYKIINILSIMKEEKPIFLKVFAIVILVLFINIGVFTYSNRESIEFNKGLTGFSVNEVITDNNTKLSPFSKILIITQWSFLGLILIFASAKDRRFKKQKIELEGIKINPSKEQTDLDKIYNILKERKQIKVKNITKLFNITYDIALEWAKILESGNLAEIDYPMFGGPILNIKTEKDKDDLNKDASTKDTQTDKKQELNQTPKKIKKSKSIPILFILTLGFLAYPLYWLYNNNWNYQSILQNKQILILIIIALFFAFIFLIQLIKRIFRKKDPKIKNKKQKTKEQPKEESKTNKVSKEQPKEEPKTNQSSKKQPKKESKTKSKQRKKKPTKKRKSKTKKIEK